MGRTIKLKVVVRGLEREIGNFTVRLLGLLGVDARASNFPPSDNPGFFTASTAQPSGRKPFRPDPSLDYGVGSGSMECRSGTYRG